MPAIVDEVLRSPGEPLDPATRAFVEPHFSDHSTQSTAALFPQESTAINLVIGPADDRYEEEANRLADTVTEEIDTVSSAQCARGTGYDFRRVRVHTDARAAESARMINALAYTVGRHVVFGAGQFRPGTKEGTRLLAHELGHVAQQTSLGACSLQRKTASTLATKVVDHGVSADAVDMAKRRMNQVLGSLQDPAAGELKGATIELHIIPHDKKLTDLPEFASLKGTKTFDGRAYDELRGVGATKTGDTIRYAIAEEQLVSIKGKPSEYELGFVAAHESGHVVEQFGLTKDQKKTLQEAYDERKKAGGPWLSPDWYTSSGTGEYFAQSTSAYFGRPYSSSEEDKKTYTREWLKKNDPSMAKLLGIVYAS